MTGLTMTWVPGIPAPLPHCVGSEELVVVLDPGEVEAELAGDWVDLGCAGQRGVGEVDGQDHRAAGG